MNADDWVVAASDFAFRPLTRADFPMVLGWLNEPHVREWWVNDPSTEAAVEEKYGPRVDGTSPTRCFVALLGDRPIGVVHAYRVGDYAYYAERVGFADGVRPDHDHESHRSLLVVGGRQRRFIGALSGRRPEVDRIDTFRDISG